jgi:L-seryl-tRNA(Ser) seleniumtransferase
MAVRKTSVRKDSPLRQIPSVDELLRHPAASSLASAHGREALVEGLRAEVQELRDTLRRGGASAGAGPLPPEAILARAAERIAADRRPRLRRVINATGVILHTGLGRAVLPPAALRAIAEEHRGYSLLEVDGETGERNYREVHVADLLRRLTGAEAATVVNNNAGATLLALSALAAGREVVVSRGQLVEIGGSYRLPEIMQASGAKLVEVGTTNRTGVRDYEQALTPATAMILRVHTSNYRILGFTASARLDELVALGRKHNLPVVDDIGSGALVDLSGWGIPDEPRVQDSVKAGADLILFSGDKLLGGPQAGILLGRAELVGRIRRHPLFRALRIDKISLTALEATLKLFLDGDRLASELPTLRLIARDRKSLEKESRSLAERLARLPDLEASVVEDASEVGGGSVPALSLPTVAVSIRHRRLSPDDVAARLRANDPPVFARIKKDRLLVDPRTLLDGDANDLVTALERIPSSGPATA